MSSDILETIREYKKDLTKYENVIIFNLIIFIGWWQSNSNIKTNNENKRHNRERHQSKKIIN